MGQYTIIIQLGYMYYSYNVPEKVFKLFIIIIIIITIIIIIIIINALQLTAEGQLLEL